MAMVIKRERFENVDAADESDFVEWAYIGVNYTVEVEGRQFQVRAYDDEPGHVTVIGPADAWTAPQAKELVAFLTRDMGAAVVQFLHPAKGYYVPVDTKTLAFQF